MGNGNTRSRQARQGGGDRGAYTAVGSEQGGDRGGGYPGGSGGGAGGGSSGAGQAHGAAPGAAVHVVCPQCHAVLVPPARVFRCPCGQTMTYNVPRPRGDSLLGASGLRFVALGGRGHSEQALHAMMVEQRIHSLLRSLPPSDPQAIMLAQLLRRLPRNPDGTISQEALTRLAEELETMNGAPRPVVDALPLHNYKPPTSKAEAAEEQQSCMVCLGEYEENEVIRTLPCLHIFHQPCIDKWLQAHKTCPLCKHDVTIERDELADAMRESREMAEKEEAARRAKAASATGEAASAGGGGGGSATML